MQCGFTALWLLDFTKMTMALMNSEVMSPYSSDVLRQVDSVERGE